MEESHYQLWTRCETFVADVCAGRDSSHGLEHMRKVTKNSLLILGMEHKKMINLPLTFSRVILVAMLHDVADHKYDVKGTLLRRVREFLATEKSELTAAGENGDEAVDYALTAIEAVSFSKEKKRGRRWFEAELPLDWVLVRDIVSDADKLEAIGGEGLQRCLEYTKHALLTEEGNQVRDADDFHSRCLQRVRDHYAEKLGLLSTEFIVSIAGKYLAAPLHEEMKERLERWENQGLPSSLQ